MSNLPAIVIAAYNRPLSLQRLLRSIAEARFDSANIDLIISIDKSDADEVYTVAERFDWKHGQKKIIRHNEHLGLKEHILRCGDLTREYQSIILFEDDLFVSPCFFQYASVALGYYSNDSQVAGISLYSYQISENGFFPFYPHHDGCDVYFMQLPSSWGLALTESAWNDFKNWNIQQGENPDESILPLYIIKWRPYSWKKRLAAYLIATDKYFVFPRISYCTNFDDPGTTADRKGLFQTLVMYAEKNFAFKRLDNSLAVYDAWYEIRGDVIKRLNSKLQPYELTVDLHGTKNEEQINTDYVLSGKKCKRPVFSFGNDLPDPVQNILTDNVGDFYSLGRIEDFEDASPHVFNFYTTLAPISDIVMSKHIEHMEFNTRYPKLFIGIFHEQTSEFLQQTLESISAQSYPSSQMEVVVFHSRDRETDLIKKDRQVKTIGYENFSDLVKQFCSEIDIGDCEYFVTLRSGDTFYPKAFEAMNTIFRRYPDLTWLTGIETISSGNGFNIFYGNTAMRRWNRHIYERNLYKDSGRYIPPAATFWKRHIWKAAKPYLNFVSLNSFFEDIWLAFFKLQKLFTCDVYFSSSPLVNNPGLKRTKSLIGYSLVEDDFRNKLQEFFFVNNVPYLREYYRAKNNLSEVIRLDYEGQWYFQSNF